ncbi:MAG: hypothetical protein NMK33_03220 [Candidatus Cardinium sp.]|uniref:hypothetical protein n=1 Tax=Cardinium endosymbiont of Dermatophagoides farinae TaxID=2597823 RepID=UPI001183E877|nr:hypothetical protein [Cardinium endosymbiont of Dermatophagoides farinae]TSJ80491.1 hypothetical protein FPG78_00015 [Cardinium endosymbiont of Dermatophagoides farinae]UWW96454.1 MAG: hypothetical protein NMK33_03220 [Candidatus Cardinium sp.]
MIQEKKRRYIAVFDIDDALCRVIEQTEKIELLKKYSPECPIITYIHNGDRFKGEYTHIFSPYLNILFEYSIEKGVRIAFFSSAIKERNISVIPELLISFWDEAQYQKLKSGRQFDIFSREDLRYCVKDLSVVIQKDESLLDAVLIENDPSYTAYDQEPCIYVIDLFSSYLKERCKEEENFYHFSKNSSYYIIGLFKTHFEYKKYKNLPFRVGLDQILPTDRKEYYSFFKEHPFAHKMMRIGLEEVQKKVPDAILYKSIEVAEQSPIATDQSEVKISNETKYESFVRNLIIGNIPLSIRYLSEHLFETFECSQITDEKQLAECYQSTILNLIESLNVIDDITIENGAKIYDVFITSTKKSENWHKPIAVLLSLIYEPNEKELENTAKIALQDIQPQVDMKTSSDRYISIVGVGIAFSTNSLLAAYTLYRVWKG